MKSVWGNIKEVGLKLANPSGVLVFLDFDGTLSPIVTDFAEAKIDPGVKKELKKLVDLESFFVMIVSGRKLESIRHKVGLPKVNLAGNHGLEWTIHGKYQRQAFGKRVLNSLKKTKQIFSILQKRYDRIFVEDKSLSISLHYRALNKNAEREFKKDFYRAVESAGLKKGLEFVEGKKVIDARPRVDWNKGKVVQMVKGLYPDRLSIVLGDDITDEDMFKEAFDGITVRVGKNNLSKAKYYVRGIGEVRRFLRYIYEAVSI